MSKNFCWGSQQSEEDRLLPYVVVLMVSRNKDNKEIPNFKERRQAMFVVNNFEKINAKFEMFAGAGLPGEMSRLYVSLNARDPQKVKKALLHELIDKEDFNFSSIEGVLAGIAARKENAAEKKWFFDFDSTDEELLHSFLNAIEDIDATLEPGTVRTPHGYAVVVNHGFDIRPLNELMLDYNDVITLKRDDLICVNWKVKK